MRHASTSGYAMAALLVGLSVMSIMRGAALPVWQTAIKRQREAELIFRGDQYAQAISLFPTTIRRNVSTQYRCPRKAASAGA
jgi:type II secretory pathway pseudopilin PulG